MASATATTPRSRGTSKGSNATTTSKATAGKRGYPVILQALAAETESLWILARAYLSEVAPGMPRVAKADYDGLVAWLTSKGSRVPAYNTLRQQRAVAAFWPDTAQLPGVGFSVHRELMQGEKSFRTATATANKVAATMGKARGLPGPVPLAHINVDAIRVHRGLAIQPSGKVAKGKVAKGKAAQAGQQAQPIVPATSSPTDTAQAARQGMVAVTRAILIDLTAEELEGLLAIHEGLGKRLQTEVQRRKAAATKAAKAASTAGKQSKARQGVR